MGTFSYYFLSTTENFNRVNFFEKFPKSKYTVHRINKVGGKSLVEHQIKFQTTLREKHNHDHEKFLHYRHVYIIEFKLMGT